MQNRDFVEENEAARQELGHLVSGLDERSFQSEVGPGWTVSTLLCHLAFWDQRALFLLTKWQAGQFEAPQLNPQGVDSINEAVKVISQAVPGSAAAKLALESAAAVDRRVAEISEELAVKSFLRVWKDTSGALSTAGSIFRESVSHWPDERADPKHPGSGSAIMHSLLSAGYWRSTQSSLASWGKSCNQSA